MWFLPDAIRGYSSSSPSGLSGLFKFKPFGLIGVIQVQALRAYQGYSSSSPSGLSGLFKFKPFGLIRVIQVQALRAYRVIYLMQFNPFFGIHKPQTAKRLNFNNPGSNPEGVTPDRIRRV
jgi:hypothetical protein